jgi:hypothetical protein
LHILDNIERVKLQEQYLMLKCTHENETKIFGIWIHDEDVRKKAKESLERILKVASSAGNHGDDLIQKLSILKVPAAAQSGQQLSSGMETNKKDQSASSSSLEKSRESPENSTTENKSVKLLSLLKKSVPDNISTTSSSSSPVIKPLVLNPPVHHPVAPPAVLPVTQTNTQKKSSSSSVVSSSIQKAEHLLSLINSNKGGAKQETSPKAELLTDGDIAKKVSNKPIQIPVSLSSPPSTAVTANTNGFDQKINNRSRGNSGTDLLALLSEPPQAISKVNEPVNSTNGHIKAFEQLLQSDFPVNASSEGSAKKTIPSIAKKPMLISPSDLGI